MRELMTEDLRAYEATPVAPQQSNFDEHDLREYIIERKKPHFYARGFDYNGSQLHGYKMVVPHYYPIRDLDTFFQENKSAFYERLQPVAKRVETLRQKTAHSTNSIRHTSNTPLPLFKVV